MQSTGPSGQQPVTSKEGTVIISVLERIEDLRRSAVENIIFFINYGGIESRKVLVSLELLSTEVMPRFAD